MIAVEIPAMSKYNFKLSTTRDYRDCEDIKFLVALTVLE